MPIGENVLKTDVELLDEFLYKIDKLLTAYRIYDEIEAQYDPALLALREQIAEHMLILTKRFGIE